MSRRAQSRNAAATAQGTRIRLTIGAPGEDDNPARRQATASASSASSLSVRTVFHHVPSLATLCARVFAANFKQIAERETSWPGTRRQLDGLPDMIIPPLFSMIASHYPAMLSHGVIAQHFLRGTSVVLSSDLPGVIKPTIVAIGRNGQNLRHLRLTGFEKISDVDFAALCKNLPALHTVNLRGCSKIAIKTTEAVAAHCPELRSLNLSYTAVNPIHLSSVLQNCRQLQILKLAGLYNWTDANFNKLWSALTANNLPITFLNIQQLKLRHAPLTELSFLPMLIACPNLKRLDVGFTKIRHVNVPQAIVPSLEKLVLTSTGIPGPEIIEVLGSPTKLRTLHLDAMGGGQGTAVRIDNSTAMTLSDALLRDITDALEHATELEVVSLSGNTKLGQARHDSALSDFTARIGRRCKRLHLSGIKRLKSSDFTGLIAEDPDQPPPRLENLVIDNTDVGDEAVPFISACQDLRTMSAAGTKFTSEGLFPLIGACNLLEQLDLTGCRGVGVVDRRRFFEVWENNQTNNNNT